MNYITGEKIQELVDYTIVFNNQININVALVQLKNTNCEGIIFDGFKNIEHLPEKIHKVKSLFVYTYALDMFFDKIYPLLKKPYIIVTHNSDNEISDKYIDYLNSEKIKRWYSQNINFKHPKLISIPIGIANSQWEHGNLQLLDKIRNENLPKNNLVYKNFDVKTSINRRLGVLEKTNNIMLTRNRKQEDYLRDIAFSKFNICPMGNGIDTHRMWESIYLGSIPIVQNCINTSFYRELPILEIEDWSCLNEKYLNEKYDEIMSKKYNYRKIDLEYWKKEINKE